MKDNGTESSARHLLFVWSPAGYQLREGQGDPPAVGSEIDEDGRTMRISKVAQSPLPGDKRRCAYTQPV